LYEKDKDRLYLLIHDYFKRLLLEWGDDLQARPGTHTSLYMYACACVCVCVCVCLCVCVWADDPTCLYVCVRLCWEKERERERERERETCVGENAGWAWAYVDVPVFSFRICLYGPPVSHTQLAKCSADQWERPFSTHIHTDPCEHAPTPLPYNAEFVKRSMQGKIETVTMQQAHESMRPFFKMLKTKVPHPQALTLHHTHRERERYRQLLYVPRALCRPMVLFVHTRTSTHGHLITLLHPQTHMPTRVLRPCAWPWPTLVLAHAGSLIEMRAFAVSLCAHAGASPSLHPSTHTCTHTRTTDNAG
jgi:hypothetical protein